MSKYLHIEYFIIYLLLLSFVPLVVQGMDAKPNNSDISLDQSSSDKQVKVLTYNLENNWDIGWKDNIQKENPDIILFQEIGDYYLNNDNSSLLALIQELSDMFPDENPYQVATFSAVSVSDGQAVVSRFPILNFKVLREFTLDNGQTWKINHPIIDATIHIFDQDIHFFTNHLTCCQANDTRLTEQEGIMNYIDTLGDVPMVYAGDFNTDSPQDIQPSFQNSYDTDAVDVMINPSNPKAPKTITFTDSYRVLNPGKRGWTLLGYETGNNGSYWSNDIWAGRIDYIFVSQHLVGNLVRSHVVYDYPEAYSHSDHTLLYTILNFDETKDLKPPLPLTNVDTQVIDNNIQISWTPSDASDLYAYRIYRNGCHLTDLPSTETSYTDMSTQVNSLYNYQITAIDDSYNEGELSLPTYVNSTFGQLDVPQAPLLKGSTAPKTFDLNWTASSIGTEITHYKVYISTPYDPYYNIIGVGNYTEFRKTTQITNAEVSFFVLASNIVGDSVRSNVLHMNDLGGIKLDENVTSLPFRSEVVTTNQDPNTCPVPGQVLADPPIFPRQPYSYNPNTVSNTDTGNGNSSNTGKTYYMNTLVLLVAISSSAVIIRKKRYSRKHK